MAVAFGVRAIPFIFIGGNGFLNTYDTDTWYTLRQVEVMVSQFPGYPWFDPMTAFPDGKTISWGPLFPFVAGALCLILGATTQPEIVRLTMWISPVLGTLLVPVMYILGKTVWDERAGLVAAGLSTVVSFRFFFLSMYGYVDHHIMELFFSTLFLTVYVVFLSLAKKNPPDIHVPSTLKVPVAVALVSGILYFLALITSTTVLLVIPVIAVFTFVRIVLDYVKDSEPVPLLLLNGIAFSVVTLLLILFGIDGSSFAFTGYSLGLVLVLLSVVAETLVLWVLTRIFQGKPILFVSGIGILALVTAGMALTLPALRSITLSAMQLLFGPSAFSTVVQETLPWSVSTAWANFNLSIVLMAAGLLILVYYCIRERKTEHLFFLVWSAVMLFATVRYRRFEYYSTINIILLAAICITEPFRWAGEGFLNSIRSSIPCLGDATRTADAKTHDSKEDAKKSGTHGKRKNTAEKNRKPPATLIKALCILGIVTVIVMIAVSAIQDVDYANGTSTRRISTDWIESLDWLRGNTPDPGVDYFRIYDRDFSYPEEAYGIMAPWSAGHWITFFSHRIPITNPFQDNLAGPSGAAAYFLSDSEPAASTILTNLGGKYVITDSSLAVDTFSSLVPWQNNSVDVTPHIKWFLVPSDANPSVLLRDYGYDDAYFRSMAVRLQIFDGSLTLPGDVIYIEYTIRTVPSSGETADVNGVAPVITRKVIMNASEAETAMQDFNRNAGANRRAIILSDMPDEPITTVPALQHYRLVHESPGNATVTRFDGTDPVMLPWVKTVKVFEYTPGAKITGEGVIEIPIRTNTGRIFLYRQESVNGTFTVPYPTTGSPYDTGATGQYHLLGTNRYISVTEQDVINGNRIDG